MGIDSLLLLAMVGGSGWRRKVFLFFLISAVRSIDLVIYLKPGTDYSLPGDIVGHHVQTERYLRCFLRYRQPAHQETEGKVNLSLKLFGIVK